MPSWKPEDELTHPYDFTLVQNSFVILYWRNTVLDAAINEMTGLGYHVADRSIADLHDIDDDVLMMLADALDFPAYFGDNFNALNDCMRDVAAGAYGWPETATGLVIVLRRYDLYVSQSPRAAHLLLDILAYQARCAIMVGNRIIVLVQTDDAWLDLPDVGAMALTWNDSEWENDRRRPPSADTPTAAATASTPPYRSPAPSPATTAPPQRSSRRWWRR